MTLLFELATWHGLAKLRMHTDTTLDFLDSSTIRLGQLLRDFNATTCAEENSLRRRKASTKFTSIDPKGEHNSSKTLNLSTYTLHSLGDYADTIRRYGTTDNYTTQIVRILPLFSVIVLTATRVNSSIAESSASIPLPARMPLREGLRSNSNDRGHFTSRNP